MQTESANLYEHEAAHQLAKEFGLNRLTPADITEEELGAVIRAATDTYSNPKGFSAPRWVTSFILFAKGTGRQEVLASPSAFARQFLELHR